MESKRKMIRLVGVLFIIQMVAAVLSYSVILDPILYTADYLNALSNNATSATFAMLLDLIVGASVFAIAVLLFPVLKRINESLALWYAGQRLIEWVGLMVSGVLLLTLLKIGQQVGNNPDVSNQLETLAYYLRDARVHVQDISLIVYCFGAWAFYGMMAYSKLIPRLISIWGLIAVCLLFIEIVANVFNKSVGGIMIMMPLGINELFLGFWLIIKGFDSRLVE